MPFCFVCNNSKGCAPSRDPLIFSLLHFHNSKRRDSHCACCRATKRWASKRNSALLHPRDQHHSTSPDNYDSFAKALCPTHSSRRPLFRVGSEQWYQNTRPCESSCMSVRPTSSTNLRARSPHSQSEGSDLVQAGENENPIVLTDEPGYASS